MVASAFAVIKEHEEAGIFTPCLNVICLYDGGKRVQIGQARSSKTGNMEFCKVATFNLFDECDVFVWHDEHRINNFDKKAFTDFYRQYVTVNQPVEK